MLRRLGAQLPERLGGHVEATVENAGQLDLSEFDHQERAGVILDGVGDPVVLKVNREALQGRPKVQEGARSATTMYSYLYTTFGRGLVATFDLSARNLGLFPNDHWLRSRKKWVGGLGPPPLCRAPRRSGEDHIESSNRPAAGVCH